ncbi:MAG TPA: hypothetical protein VNL18_02285 [Gemmatimonadales bacterium]|nr:hypothetical protein [Gemmatimonadales bacterium]
MNRIHRQAELLQCDGGEGCFTPGSPKAATVCRAAKMVVAAGRERPSGPPPAVFGDERAAEKIAGVLSSAL